MWCLTKYCLVVHHYLRRRLVKDRNPQFPQHDVGPAFIQQTVCVCMCLCVCVGLYLAKTLQLPYSSSLLFLCHSHTHANTHSGGLSMCEWPRHLASFTSGCKLFLSFHSLIKQRKGKDGVREWRWRQKVRGRVMIWSNDYPKSKITKRGQAVRVVGEGREAENMEKHPNRWRRRF